MITVGRMLSQKQRVAQTHVLSSGRPSSRGSLQLGDKLLRGLVLPIVGPLLAGRLAPTWRNRAAPGVGAARTGADQLNHGNPHSCRQLGQELLGEVVAKVGGPLLAGRLAQ